jgi:hypothetical protein
MKHFYLIFLFVFSIAFAFPIETTIIYQRNNPAAQTSDIKIFPNPSKGNEVTIISKTDVTVEVYDILGKKVKVQNITLNQNKLNITELKKGVYLLKFKTDTDVITKKLIRQ